LPHGRGRVRRSPLVMAALAAIFIAAASAALPARPPAAYDTCGRSAVAGRFNISSSIPDPFGGGLSLVEAVCCDSRNARYAEPQNLYTEVALFAQLDSSGVTTFYDSASQLPLFRAPVGRTFAAFRADTRTHGWPSFRGDEIVTKNVLTNLTTGLVASISGTHLGSYLPDTAGPRWCIDLACISGLPAAAAQ